MNLKLPKIAEDLIDATNTKDVLKYVSCFAEDAIYIDSGENEKVVGLKAIEENFRAMTYDLHSVPTDLKVTPNKITLKVQTSGNFKGSPLNFEYQIELRSGLIENLRIDLVPSSLPNSRVQ